MLRDWQNLNKREMPAADLTLAQQSYDECIAALDLELGRLFDELERRELLDNTIVIVTADHGEQFGEHGEYGHGRTLYQEEVHVPLLIRFPRQGSARTSDPRCGQPARRAGNRARSGRVRRDLAVSRQVAGRTLEPVRAGRPAREGRPGFRARHADRNAHTESAGKRV